MDDICKRAISYVENQAVKTEAADLVFIEPLLRGKNMDAAEFIDCVFKDCAVTINFSPDWLTKNGATIIQGLCEEGKYKTQYVTGISNGGLTAQIGHDRDLWEKKLFGAGTYTPDNINNRPIYGALNVFSYLDGGIARFGSCFLALKPHIIDRCTFAARFVVDATPDKYPGALGTKAHFYSIVRELFEIILNENGVFLDKTKFSIEDAINCFINPNTPTVSSNNINCIEAHIHGGVSLEKDLESIHIDESFKNTETHDLAGQIADKCSCELLWIPERKKTASELIAATNYDNPAVAQLVRKIAAKYPESSGDINAALIGRALRESIEGTLDVETTDRKDLLRIFKRLWQQLVNIGHID